MSVTLATERLPRRVRAVVGPPGKPEAGLVFDDTDGWEIEGVVKSFKGSKPNEGEVTLWNLSSATIAQLEKPGQVLQISAGLGFKGQLFVGSVTRGGVQTANDIPTRRTTIQARDGRRVYRDTRVSRAWPRNVQIATVVQDLLSYATAKGIALGLESQYPTGVYPDGYAAWGNWRKALRKVLDPEGYYWTIQGGVIYVLSEAAAVPGNVPLITPDTGLTGSPERADKGCRIESILNPAIRAGRAVQAVSKFFNGLYRVVNCSHGFSSDSLAGAWETKAQCEVIK